MHTTFTIANAPSTYFSYCFPFFSIKKKRNMFTKKCCHRCWRSENPRRWNKNKEAVFFTLENEKRLQYLFLFSVLCISLFVSAAFYAWRKNRRLTTVAASWTLLSLKSTSNIFQKCYVKKEDRSDKQNGGYVISCERSLKPELIILTWC